MLNTFGVLLPSISSLAAADEKNVTTKVCKSKISVFDFKEMADRRVQTANGSHECRKQSDGVDVAVSILSRSFSLRFQEMYVKAVDFFIKSTSLTDRFIL